MIPVYHLKYLIVLQSTRSRKDIKVEILKSQVRLGPKLKTTKRQTTSESHYKENYRLFNISPSKYGNELRLSG